MTRNKCTFSAGHFNDHGGVWVQCQVHCPMQTIQGNTKSLWMPPSGKYSICIALAAVRVLCKTTAMKKYTYIDGHFDGHSDALEQYRTHCPMEEIQGFARSHWMPSLGEHLLQ
jgi:hypothetical protein